MVKTRKQRKILTELIPGTVNEQRKKLKEATYLDTKDTLLLWIKDV